MLVLKLCHISVLSSALKEVMRGSCLFNVIALLFRDLFINWILLIFHMNTVIIHFQPVANSGKTLTGACSILLFMFLIRNGFFGTKRTGKLGTMTATEKAKKTSQNIVLPSYL